VEINVREREISQVGKVGFHPSGAAPLGTPGLPPPNFHYLETRVTHTLESSRGNLTAPLEPAPNDLRQKQRGLHQAAGGKPTSQAAKEFGRVLVIAKPPEIR
jgi:hypothetical protein